MQLPCVSETMFVSSLWKRSFIDRRAFTDDATHTLSLMSSALVLLLAINLSERSIAPLFSTSYVDTVLRIYTSTFDTSSLLELA